MPVFICPDCKWCSSYQTDANTVECRNCDGVARKDGCPPPEKIDVKLRWKPREFEERPVHEYKTPGLAGPNDDLGCLR